MIGAFFGVILALPYAFVEKLDHPLFRQREFASRALAKLGKLAVPALKRCRTLGPEGRRRREILLDRYREELAHARAAAWGELPWISTPDWYRWHTLAVRHTPAAECRAPLWTDYRVATRLWLASQLVQRRPLGEIEGALAEMREEEVRWLEDNPEYRRAAK